MDHQQRPVRQFDRHHLQCNSIRVISEAHDAGIGAECISRAPLLEAQAAVLDDIARLFMGYPMLGR
jgi:hypothetical protein